MMDRNEQLTILNRAWLVAQELIRECAKDGEVRVDCERLQASVEHIERSLGYNIYTD